MAKSSLLLSSVYCPQSYWIRIEVLWKKTELLTIVVQRWYFTRAMIHDFTTVKHSIHFAMDNKHFVRRAPEEDSCSSPSSVSQEPDLFRKGVLQQYNTQPYHSGCHKITL